MPTVEGTRLLSLEEAADMLRKTPRQLRNMIHAGTAPLSAKIGGRRMFRESDVETFVAKAFEDAAARRGAV